MKLRENDQYIEKALELKIPITSLPDSFTKFDLFTIVHELEGFVISNDYSLF